MFDRVAHLLQFPAGLRVELALRVGARIVHAALEDVKVKQSMSVQAGQLRCGLSRRLQDHRRERRHCQARPSIIPRHVNRSSQSVTALCGYLHRITCFI